MRFFILRFLIVIVLLPGCYRKVKRGVDGTGGRAEIRIGNVGGQGGEVLGTGGHTTLLGGEIGEGGQGGGGENAGGIEVPAPTLRYAPQVWRPEQAKFDLTACGNVPLTPLEFKPVDHPGFDEIDPETHQPIPSHWYASTRGPWMDYATGWGPVASSNVDVAFSWTAPEAGNYTFRVSPFMSRYITVRVFVREECDQFGTELFVLDGDGSVSASQNGRIEASPVFLEAGQSVYGLVLWNNSRFRSSTVIHVYRSDGHVAPEIIEAQARRDPDTRRIDVLFNAIDLNQDIVNVEFQLLEEAGGEAVPIFEDGDETWIPFRGSKTFYRPAVNSTGRNNPRDKVGVPLGGALQGYREVRAHAYVYPPLSFVNEPAFVRFKLRDLRGNESDVVELEIAEGVFEGEGLNTAYALGQQCIVDGECGSERCKDVEGIRQCVAKPAVRVDTATVYQTDDQLRVQVIANDPSNSLATMEIQLLDEDGAENDSNVSFFVDGDWGPNLFKYDHVAGTLLDLSSEGQEEFRFGTSWWMEVESLIQRQARINLGLGTGETHRRQIEGSDNPWIDVNIEPMPMAQLGEACDPYQYQNVCIYGTACEEQEGAEPTCQEASIPRVESVRAEWNSTLEVLNLDLEGQGDVLGYKLRGFRGIDEEDVFFLGHTELSEGQFQSHGEHRLFWSNLSIPDEAWIEVISRQGYSSEPFRFEVLENAQTACELIEPCMEGFECKTNPHIRGEAICAGELEEPGPPILESLTVRYDPVSKMASIEGTGRTEIEWTQYHVSVRFNDENGEYLKVVNFWVDDLDADPARFSFSSNELVDIGLNQHLSLTSTVVGGVFEVVGGVFGYRYFNGENIGLGFGDLINGEIEVIPTVQLGEVCDASGNENSCALGSRCESEGIDGPRCVDDSHSCLPNRLNAHINAWEVLDETSQIGVRWESLPQPFIQMYLFDRIERSYYENDCFVGYMYSFTAPSEGLYQFAVKKWEVEESNLIIRGIRVGLSSSCNAPSTDLSCENRYQTAPEDYSLRGKVVRSIRHDDCEGFSCGFQYNFGYQNQSALYQALEEGETVYLYVAHSHDSGSRFDVGMHTVSVDLYSSAPEIIPQGAGSQTRATLDSAVRKGQIQLEIGEMGPRIDLARLMVEYELLDAGGNLIPLGMLGGGVDPEERWLIPLQQLPKTPLPNADVPFVARTSAFTVPTLEDRLGDIAAFRVRLLNDGGVRSEPIDIQIETPELVQEGRDCDPYGFYNRCPDGLVCMSLKAPNQCEVGGLDEDEAPEGTRCYEPTELCPRDACPADWDEKIIDLNASAEPDGSWLHAETFQEEHPNKIEYSLGAYCSSLIIDQHHVYAFTAQEPGRYRARLLTDAVDQLNYSFNLNVRDVCTRAETDFGCSLEDSNASLGERVSYGYERQYFEEPFLLEAISLSTYRETRMDLHGGQTIYLFVSTLDLFLEDEENIPYQLMLEKL